MPTPGHRSSWEDKLARSGLFVAAVLFHLVVFLIVAGWVVFNAPPVQPDAVFVRFPLPQNPVPPPTPPPNPAAPPSVDVIGKNPIVDFIIPPPHSPFNFGPGAIDIAGSSQGPSPVPAPHPQPTNPFGELKIPGDRLQKIRDFVLAYQSLEDIDRGVLKAKFPVYVASYANGDWACNSRLDAQGNIIGGSMPDLAAKIAEWSHGQIQAQVMPKPLNIGGSELLDKKPPFIFFTGHENFVLTDQEIANLRDYLEAGGLIWGDNALAGRESRFDVAFRREMKRVVPNLDLNFNPMSLDADLFTKSQYPITQLPAGMNYYCEPIEHLDLDGKLAILYTPNDYSDLLFMRILPGDTEIGPTGNNREYTSPLITSGIFYYNHSVFFRNFTLPTALAVHRLGMNIVVHLLTRFDDELQLMQ